MDARARPTPRLGVVVAAAALALASVLLVWVVAVPSGPLICPAVYPAPTNCRAEFRVGTGVVASLATGAAFPVTALVVLRRPAWKAAATACLVVLVAAPVLAYTLVIGLPGFTLD